MKITYNILWVEDSPEWYEAMLEHVKSILEEEGFELKSERYDNIQEIEDLINKDGLKKFDMLLVDFNLKTKDSGDKIIKLIRDSGIYTDVLFYSVDIEKIRDSISKHVLEGVYTTDRRDFEDKFKHVFLTTIKKIQEVNSMRGLIMGETSELDIEIENIAMQLVYGQLKLSNDDINKIIEDYVNDNLRKKTDSFWERYNEIGFKKIFHEIESSRKWNIFRKLLKRISNDEIKIFLESNKTYGEEVIHIRNIFAHVKVEEKDGKDVLIGVAGKEIVVDEDKCKTIRQNIIKHRRNIDHLKSILRL